MQGMEKHMGSGGGMPGMPGMNLPPGLKKDLMNKKKTNFFKK